MTFFARFKSNFPYSSIIILIAGLALLFYPEASQAVLCALVGGSLIVKGGAGLIARLRNKGNVNVFPLESVWNVLLLGMGVFVAFNPAVVVSILPYAFGLFLLVSSITSLQKTAAMRQMESGKWVSGAIFAVIRIALAAFLMLRPFATGVALTRFIGACLVYDGAATAFTAVEMIRARIEYDKRNDEVRDMNLSKNNKSDDAPVETVEAEFVDVVQDAIDVD